MSANRLGAGPESAAMEGVPPKLASEAGVWIGRKQRAKMDICRPLTYTYVCTQDLDARRGGHGFVLFSGNEQIEIL